MSAAGSALCDGMTLAVAASRVSSGLAVVADAELELFAADPNQRLCSPVLERSIETIQVAAVFVGASGIGPWQQYEVGAYLRQFASRRGSVIPVLLPSAQLPSDLPGLLGGFTWVDFREAEPDPIERLCWGITGKRPMRF